MDLIDVREIRVPSTRDGLVLAPGHRVLGGGTWLFSEPQHGVCRDGPVDGPTALEVEDETRAGRARCGERVERGDARDRKSSGLAGEQDRVDRDAAVVHPAFDLRAFED